MHTFRVVKERHGWAVRMGEGMTTPFWTRSRAVRRAESLRDTLRGHGVLAEVVIEEGDLVETGAGAERSLSGALAADPSDARPVWR